ncbi:MAG: hypothetical protein DRN81_04520 [Thermoproteota archaeon]|nr:MAG: hypothetical protein DRN81_04520 [Candidatus Korarchaeota archaeon]
MDLAIDLAEIEKVKAELWSGKVEIQLIGRDWTNEVVLRGYTDGDSREVVAKLKGLLAAVAKVLGYLDPQSEVGLVEVECEVCQDRRYYPIVVQDLFDGVKEVKGAA